MRFLFQCLRLPMLPVPALDNIEALRLFIDSETLAKNVASIIAIENPFTNGIAKLHEIDYTGD